MLPRLRVSLVVVLCLASLSFAARAEQPSVSTEDTGEASPAAAMKPPLAREGEEPPRAQPPPSDVTARENPTAEPAAQATGWQTEVNGYFRAPVSLGLSSRPNPDEPGGPSHTQITYGPNRVFDWNYYSFAYTRLQEQDWAELFVHARKKHVDAVIGWMGYWFQGAGFRNPDAAWIPGMAYLTLDTDFGAGERTSNIALTTGAFWPKFGYFEKYDTYTLGRFRQIGTQAKLTLPFGTDWTVVGTAGFGTSRDGSYNFGLNNISPLYAGQTNLDLMAWANFQVMYQKFLDAAVHVSTEWMADPSQNADTTVTPKSYTAASASHLSVLGAEVNLRMRKAGHLWISPSFVSIKNGWALGTGTEVMHSLGGFGVAQNYFAWTGSPESSTGSGSMTNIGFLYENTLSGVRGKTRGSMLPDLAVSVFALYAGASIDLPATTALTQGKIRQLKYGADATLQLIEWVGLMLRGDMINYDMDHPGFVLAALTGRVAVSSHFLSSERIYLQFSRYIYGDNIKLNGVWPWGQSLVAGSNVIQQASAYSMKKPDENVIKLQSEIAF